MIDDQLPELPEGAFAKQDVGDDLAFYAPPRLVTHIDAGVEGGDKTGHGNAGGVLSVAE